MSDYVEDQESFEALAPEWEEYEKPSEFKRPPDAGKYSLMRTTEDGDFKGGVFETSDGQECAWYNFKTVIVGGDNDGDTVFAGCNTMKSKFRAGTTVQDFIRAANSPLRPLAADLVAEAQAYSLEDDGHPPYTLESVIGPFRASLDWEGRCRDCEETFLKGQRKPKVPKKYTGPKFKPSLDKDRTASHEQKCPRCEAVCGANAVVKNYIVD